MNISLAIADSNRDYVEKLSEVLQQYSELIIHVYTSAEKLEAAMEKSGFDVVLFDPDLTERKIIFQKVKLPIELYSDEAINRGLYPDMEKIIKYQRISAIYKEIVRAYADKAGYSLDFDNSQKTKILAVHSPLGGCGKTVISLVIASKMVGLGKSVLYLNLEQLNSSICLNPKVEEGVTALVESLGDGHTNFEFRVRGSLKIGLNGISYIEGFDRIVDYEAVEEREITEVVTKLKRLGICDVIVIDMNNQIDGMSKALYEIADQVILVDRPGELPTTKMQLFARQSITAQYENKMIRVHNFVENNSRFNPEPQLKISGEVTNYGNLPLINLIQSISANNQINWGMLLQ